MKGLNKNNEQQQKITVSSAKNMYIIQKGTIEANCYKKTNKLKKQSYKGKFRIFVLGCGN